MGTSSVPAQAVLRSLAEYVEYQLEEGVQSVELPPGSVVDLKPLVQRRAKPAPRQPGAPRAAQMELSAIAESVTMCRKCGLHETRTRTVPGQGSPHPEIMFVGEAPGEEEDRQGLAFVGEAGQLLTKMIEAMGYRRDEVFIANILKCRPPHNRTPLPAEMDVCLPYLKEQIALLKPKVIVCLGGTALRGLLNLEGITRLRGQWLSYEGIDLMPTFHPSYLLRTPSAKREEWEDLKAVLRHLGRPIPDHRKAQPSAAGQQ
jgi:DNA polymerase